MKMLKQSKTNKTHKIEFQTMELIDIFDLWFECYWKNLGGIENDNFFGMSADYRDLSKFLNGGYTYLDLLKLMSNNKTMCKICQLIPKELDQFMFSKYFIKDPALYVDWRYDCFKKFKNSVLKQKEDNKIKGH